MRGRPATRGWHWTHYNAPARLDGEPATWETSGWAQNSEFHSAAQSACPEVMLVTRRSPVLRRGVYAAPNGVRATGPDSLGQAPAPRASGDALRQIPGASGPFASRAVTLSRSACRALTRPRIRPTRRARSTGVK